MRTFLILIAILLSLSCESVANGFKLMPSEFPEDFIIHVNTASSSSSTVADQQNGTRWAVLVAGSFGYGNYRHQADVCHAYQILKKGGLKDENIIVFMYDDIANNVENPRPGVIINKPDGPDVYKGVPKDYTGENVTAANLYAVILGNKTALSGGSGKILDSGPNDNVFIYYTDHGASGIIGMPEGDYVYANDLVDVLKQKHEAKGYKKMVFYLESCESGSMFEGLLPSNISIYATTAANATQDSWATYCPGFDPAPPAGYDTCLGDLYSISWMEDCDVKDLRRETFANQYETVRNRTANTSEGLGSHVTQYGNLNQAKDLLFSYLGSDDNSTTYTNTKSSPSFLGPVFNQRDADLLHFLHKVRKAPDGSHEKHEAKQKLSGEMYRRERIDHNINQIAQLVFRFDSSSKMKNIRRNGQALVDDWNCFKTFVKTYEKYCGALSNYGMQYTRIIANMCNYGVTMEQMTAASTKTCS
ncbi:unnamed protein product [Malus baccata var. baccata]